MNKNIILGAFIALGALLSTGASAAISYYDSTQVIGSGVETDGNAVAAAGGGEVRANDIHLALAATGDLQPSTTTGTITVRLPMGINFSGTPKFTVTPASAGGGLYLKDSAGDLTRDAAAVTLSDTDNDGGMDRAVVTIATPSAANDTLTISSNIVVSSTVTPTTTAKTASIIIGATSTAKNLVVVTKSFVEPVFQDAKAATISQAAAGSVSSTLSFIVTIPKGTKGGTTLTVTPNGKVLFSREESSFGTTSTLTVKNHTPFASRQAVSGKDIPLTAMTSGAIAENSTATVTFTVTGTATYTLPEDVQVALTTVNIGYTATTTVTGLNGLTVKLGGVTLGTVNYFDVKKSGSAVTLAPGAKATEIVVGSKLSQTLPNIAITENFDRDFGVTSKTITITPGAGIKLETATVTFDPLAVGFTRATAGAATATISAAGVMTIEVNNAVGGSLTLTIGSLKATASAVGSLTLTVGKPGTDDTNAPNGDVITVATGVAQGKVSGALSKTTPKAISGPGGSGQSKIDLKETTYGSLSIAKKTSTTVAYVSVTTSSNAKLSSVTIAPGSGTAAYPAGTAPTFGNSGSCAAETTGSNVYICEVTQESSGISAGTSTIVVTANWSTLSTAEIGSDVVLTLDGNAGVSGSFTVGSVGLSTKVTVGAIPDVKPGSLSAVKLAPVTIAGQFANAVTDTVGATFRLLAPSGVAFQDSAAVATSTSINTAAISSTFRPNDTLSLTIATGKTATITFTPVAIFSDDVGSGLISFELIDGDINGKKLTNITAATLNLAYADGTLEKLSAGKAGDVNVGFTISNTVEGGLAPYTVASSDNTVATPTISSDVVSVKGVAVGAATITVKDALGATASYVVTVAAGAAEPVQAKATKASDGSTSTATFTGGATTDGGATYTNTLTSADDVIVNATVNVDADDVGKEGGIHAVALTPLGLLMLEEDGSWTPWDGQLTTIATYEAAEELAASYSVPLYDGKLPAGKWRFAVIYSTIVKGKVEKLVYTTKAAVISVTEAE